jgi:hypothetical protein
MFINPSGRTTSVRDEQSMNALDLMNFMPFGITMLLSEVHPLKACSGISRVPSGMRATPFSILKLAMVFQFVGFLFILPPKKEQN